MTTPQQTQPAQQPQPATDAALVTAAAELMLTMASAALVIAALRLRFTLSAVLWDGLESSLSIAMAQPPPVTGVVGAASAQVRRQNTLRRAQFAVSAGRRLASDMTAARSHGDSPVRALAAGLARERRYYSAHTAAIWNRAVAAGRADMAALEHGDLLGWHAVLDDRTSAECRAADGRNFLASAMPDIGFPGAVHPHCRCLPVAPFPGARMLPSRGIRYGRAA